MNMILCETRKFLLTIMKELEKNLQTSNKYIDQYFLGVLLFSVQHRNYLGSEKLIIFWETFNK